MTLCGSLPHYTGLVRVVIEIPSELLGGFSSVEVTADPAALQALKNLEPDSLD